MKIVLFANTDWYLFNFRRSLAVSLQERGHEVLLVSPAGPYGDRLRELGFRWVAAPMVRRSLNPVRELSFLLWLRRLLREERVDLVHGFTIKCAVYGSLAGRFARHGGRALARVNAVAGMGYVFSSSDLQARLLRPWVRAAMRLALDGANTRLIVQNPDDLELFQKEGLVSSARLRLVAGSGVDCDRFAPPAHPPLSIWDRRMRVLLPARLLWDKGVAEFIEATRMLLAEGRGIDFLLAGDPDPGNPAAVPVSALKGWCDEGIVQWLGHVDDMPGLFRSVDVVVLPSYREGLPKGLIEAAACGLPLVATDVPGCREVVTDGVDGLLVPAKDASALAGAIARLNDDDALRAKLGAAARARVLAEFDERIVIRRTVDVYRELIPEL